MAHKVQSTRHGRKWDMPHTSLQIGGLVFPQMDQMDFTGPFEVLSLIPNSCFHTIGKDLAPVRDGRGLMLTPDTTLAMAPDLDVLLVPGGHGQEALMEDEEMLEFLRLRARTARFVLSVCTGALLCGAAGLLRGVRSTTHWNSFHLLPYFGAIPVDERVVVDGKHISAAGVSSGIDGALRLAQLLGGDRLAQSIQLHMQYAPEPLFVGGTPRTSPPDIVEAAREKLRDISERRLATAKRVAGKLGVTPEAR
jgi:cyclohexyl-isocyanide hydratase